MTRQPLGIHGETHRPPGTLGPTDEGGQDPIPSLGDSFEILNSTTAVSIGNSTEAFLNWDTKVAGDDLIDITNPTFPTWVVEGMYAVSVVIAPTANITSGRAYLASLGPMFGSQYLLQTSGPQSGTAFPPYVSLSFTQYHYVGEQLKSSVFNASGATASFVIVEARIQRLR